ncbi:17735_t:CDS:1, partial [Dentiscutata erythropus]
MPCACLGAILVILMKPWISVWGCLDYLICEALSASLEAILVARNSIKKATGGT